MLGNLFDIHVDVHFPIFNFYFESRVDGGTRCLVLASLHVKLPTMPRACDETAL